MEDDELLSDVVSAATSITVVASADTAENQSVKNVVCFWWGSLPKAK